MMHKGADLKIHWGRIDGLYIVNGIIVRQTSYTCQEILVHTKLRNEVFYECHSFLTAGHLGRDTTEVNLKEERPVMRAEWGIFVRTCDTSGQYKILSRKDGHILKDFIQALLLSQCILTLLVKIHTL